MAWFRRAPKNPDDRIRRFEEEVERLLMRMSDAGQGRDALLVLAQRLRARLSCSDMRYRHDTPLIYIMLAVMAVLDDSEGPPESRQQQIFEKLDGGRSRLVETLRDAAIDHK